MRRFFAAFMALISLLALALVGCGEEEEQPAATDPLQAFRDGYAQIAAATTISQHIETKRGELVDYKKEKTYVAQSDGYTLTETVYTLNTLDSESDDPYKQETTTTTVARAEAFSSKLDLSAENFTVGFAVSGDTLTANVLEGRAGTFFGLGEEHAPMRNISLTMRLGSGKLTSMEISFVSGDNYSVHIATTFAY